MVTGSKDMAAGRRAKTSGGAFQSVAEVDVQLCMVGTTLWGQEKTLGLIYSLENRRNDELRGF